MTAAGRLRWPAFDYAHFLPYRSYHSQEHCSYPQLIGTDFKHDTRICQPLFLNWLRRTLLGRKNYANFLNR
jgi:hypothetical protein